MDTDTTQPVVVVVVVVCPLAAAVARSERYRPHESPGESCLSLFLFERPPTLGGQVFPVNSLSEGPGFPVNSLRRTGVSSQLS
jgi:hypothetical protein